MEYSLYKDKPKTTLKDIKAGNTFRYIGSGADGIVYIYDGCTGATNLRTGQQYTRLNRDTEVVEVVPSSTIDFKDL